MPTKYKNVGGMHITGDGTVVNNGETFTDENPNLCSAFPNKFEIVHDAQAEAPAAPAPASADKDVTDQFPEAVDSGLTVVKAGNAWNVLDEGELINDEPIKPKKAVTAFIEDYLDDTE